MFAGTWLVGVNWYERAIFAWLGQAQPLLYTICPFLPSYIVVAGLAPAMLAPVRAMQKPYASPGGMEAQIALT